MQLVVVGMTGTTSDALSLQFHFNQHHACLYGHDPWCKYLTKQTCLDTNVGSSLTENFGGSHLSLLLASRPYHTIGLVYPAFLPQPKTQAKQLGQLLRGVQQRRRSSNKCSCCQTATTAALCYIERIPHCNWSGALRRAATKRADPHLLLVYVPCRREPLNSNERSVENMCNVAVYEKQHLDTRWHKSRHLLHSLINVNITLLIEKIVYV